ncbi:MAG TPA: YjgN family protein [Methylomirabilota bacterium]|nr:YjgN family protein [Methylomirabilota bacterium]
MAGPAPQGPGGQPSFFRKPPEPSSSGSAPPAPSVVTPPPPAPPSGITPPPPPPPVIVPPPPAPRPSEPPPPFAGGETHRFVFHGRGGSLFGIHIVNVLLTIATLGVYYFWGKTRVRKYVWGQSEIAGDRFAYHGTGRELFLGFLKAMLFFLLPLYLLYLLRAFAPWVALKVVATVLSSIIATVFLPLAIVGARRYRLSRSSWRGIRFSFRGSAWEFVKFFIVNTLLVSLTLGLWYPVLDVGRHAFLTRHSWFGNRKFDFDGTSGGLFGRFVLSLVLTPLTLGLCWFWYLARRRRYFWEHTTFGAARFRNTTRGGPLLWLMLGNFILLIVTLGLGWPWAQVRSARFLARNLSLVGALDLDTIQQDARAASTTGEGLAGLLDVGTLDLG